MSLSKLYLEKSENELVLAESLIKISVDDKIKSLLKIKKNQTFYIGVISHSYYSIFYSAKAYLANKNIRTKVPDEHRKTDLNKLSNVAKISKQTFQENLRKAENKLIPFLVEGIK